MMTSKGVWFCCFPSQPKRTAWKQLFILYIIFFNYHFKMYTPWKKNIAPENRPKCPRKNHLPTNNCQGRTAASFRGPGFQDYITVWGYHKMPAPIFAVKTLLHPQNVKLKHYIQISLIKRSKWLIKATKYNISEMLRGSSNLLGQRKRFPSTAQKTSVYCLPLKALQPRALVWAEILIAERPAFLGRAAQMLWFFQCQTFQSLKQMIWCIAEKGFLIMPNGLNSCKSCVF